MFVITREYQGNEIAKMELLDPRRALDLIHDELVAISHDPKFSIKVAVNPVQLRP